jgi:hypothetical protein
VFATLLLVAITNTVTTVSLPSPCYDMAIFAAYFDTHDTNPVYGLKVQALDVNDRILAEGWVQESYSPPATETVPVVLTGAAKVRCEVFGPDLTNKWRDGFLAVGVNRPSLAIRKVTSGIQIDWPSSGCWHLERIAGLTNRYELFRLEMEPARGIAPRTTRLPTEVSAISE